MNTRFFLLLERQQKLDAMLRLAQSRRNADPLEIARLRALKHSLRERLASLMKRSVLRPA
ncbi:DUF465 domain-containing protein [Novosphingobium sp. M1R2S20]|uniref:DUF465 domain-containing protein n=1 Tax=Novosphingobium rhizovicinum TaxID=3228928 RepID=A0ABV3R8F8_9SPHN